MRRLYIWGMVLWSLAWVFLSPHPNPSPQTYWWLLALGTLLILAAPWGGTVIPRSWSWRVLIPVVALAVFGWRWFDMTFLGPLILAAGALVILLVGRTRWGTRLGDGIIVAGTVALFQLIGHYIYIVYLGPRGHGCAVPAAILAAAFRLFGIHASALDDGLHIFGVDRLYQVVPSPENMGLHALIMLVMGLVALGVAGKVRVRAVFAGVFAVGLFALARYAIVALWDYNHDGGLGDTFWNTRILAWTMWPIALFLQGLVRSAPAWAAESPTYRAPATPRRLVVAIVATAVGVFAWTAYESWHPAGVKKAGRMLIDEFHSDWEWSEMPFDTVWYGQQSTYNFYCLAEFWGKHYHMERGFDSLTPEVLKNYDILVLKVPTQTFSPGEIEAVYNWVHDGGGLIMIGEHTNVFGFGSFLNPVAARFGLRYIPDIVYDLKTGDLNLHHIPKILPHAVAQHLPDFLFGGPCSMYGDLSARSIITGYELKTLPADYTQRNFFPERTGHTGYRYGVFFLSLQTRCGKGRIVSFTDSTLYSNFFVFIPGKPELALGLADYVNRYDPFPYWRILTFLFAVVALSVGAIAAAGLRLEGWIWIAATGCIVFALAARVITAVNMKNYPLPQPHTPFAQLNFESEHSRFFVPELRLAREADKDFSTFYLWTQRVGIVPRKFPTVEMSLEQPGGQIIIDPETPFDASEQAALRKFVEEGGTLFVFDDPTNRRSTSNPLLVQFGLSFDLKPRMANPATSAVDYGAPEISLWQGSGQVEGGEPMLTATDGAVVCARMGLGKGQVIAFANSHIFERKTMGYTAMIPNPVQGAISRFQYRLMSYLNYPPHETQAASTTADTTSSSAP